MNLKEAFRYQNFLEKLIEKTTAYLYCGDTCLATTKRHFKSKANPEAEDNTEIVTPERWYPSVEACIGLAKTLVDERGKLSEAIRLAKASVAFDIDSAVAANGFRRKTVEALKSVLDQKPSKRTMLAKDYKFNAEGNQTPYYYDVEVETARTYDLNFVKTTMREISAEADTISSQIEQAMVNTIVDYQPPFSLTETVEDILTETTETFA